MDLSNLHLLYILGLFNAFFQLNTNIAASDDYIRCSSFFCRDSPNGSDLGEDNNCFQILNVTDTCVCTTHSLQLSWRNCQNFVSLFVTAVISTDSLWITNRTKLSVGIQNATEDDFNIFNDRFFRYLTLTNINDFTFTPFCGFDVTEDYSKHVFNQNQARNTLRFTNDYQQPKVRRLKITKGCIQVIEGKFSAMFPGITELKLNQNHLEFISDGIFEGLTFIEKLDLSGNQLGDLKNGSVFRGLNSLKYMDLSHNNRLVCIRNCFDELVNLEELHINNNKLDFSSPQVFKRNTELRVLALSSCDLEVLIPKSRTSEKWLFDGLTNLQNLSLDHNRIRYFPRGIFKSNTKLRILSLRNNSFTQLSDVTQHLSNTVLNLDFSKNCLKNVRVAKSLPDKAQCHKTIENLTCQSCCLDAKLAGKLAEGVTFSADYKTNNIDVLDMDFLKRIAHLKKVHVSDLHNKYHSMKQTDPNHLTFNITLSSYPLYLHRYSTNSQTEIFIFEYLSHKCIITSMKINWSINKGPNSSLTKSAMNSSPEYIEVANKSNPRIVEALPVSEVLKEDCNIIYYCAQTCFCHIRGFSQTNVVNCTGQSLTIFPPLDEFNTFLTMDLSNNHIRDFQNITTRSWYLFVELYLNNNCLEHLDNLTLGRNLTILDLRNNRLKHFSSLRSLLLPENQVQIKVSQNPWRCDCDTPEMKNLMNTRRTMDFEEITCNSVYSASLLSLARAFDNDFCPVSHLLISHQLTLKIVLPISAISVILLSACVIVCYRYKDFFKLWLFTRGYCLRWVTEDDIDTNKIYDAFVSYSSLDEDWVGTNLVPGLENEKPAYKLCLHSRDWPVGDWIIEQIFKSVKESRRTIIVLTENFVDSMWSRMEFDAAYQQALTDQINRVLVVVPSDVPDVTKLGNDLKNVVTLNTYIKWSDPYFWRKLRCAMPRSKQQPEIINGQRTTDV